MLVFIFQRKNIPLLYIIKPLLKYITTIDFGKLTFEYEVEEIIKKIILKKI